MTCKGLFNHYQGLGQVFVLAGLYKAMSGQVLRRASYRGLLSKHLAKALAKALAMALLQAKFVCLGLGFALAATRPRHWPRPWPCPGCYGGQGL